LIFPEPCFTEGNKGSGSLFIERRSKAISLFNIERSMFDVRRFNKQLTVEYFTEPVRTASGRSGIARCLVHRNQDSMGTVHRGPAEET
jgi:hypothetical protein